MSDSESEVTFACIGGPLDGERRARPAFFYELYHDATTLMDEKSGETYSLVWTSMSSEWRWNGLRGNDFPRVAPPSEAP